MSQTINSKKKVLIVGAGGFVGGFIAQEALSRGYEVWAGVREGTSRRYLQEPELKFSVLDYEGPEELRESLAKTAPEGGWDYIVYNLGATKSPSFFDFNRINHDYLLWFTEALKSLELIPEKFLFIS